VRRLLSVNSFPESGFVSRGATTFDIFWLGVSPVETETGERRVSGRRIEPSPVFLIADKAWRSAWRSCDLKTAAAIRDQGLFQAIFEARISIKREGLFLF